MAFRAGVELEVFENPKEWLFDFQEGFLEDYHSTGKLNWNKYSRPRNQYAPSGNSIDLASSRILLVTSSGAYLKNQQIPFDSVNPLGDYTIRTFDSSTAFKDICFSHQHFDHRFVNQDPQVLLPMQHMQDFKEQGLIGDLAPQVVSFMGYQPHVMRVVKELAPAIQAEVRRQRADAVLLIPTGPLCIQSVSLAARALEVCGIPTTFTSWHECLVKQTMPPRATVTQLENGSTLGAPGDEAQQRRVLLKTLQLLEQQAPLDLLYLDETVG